MNIAKLKEKHENYWYYYKTHTLVGIFVIFVIVYTIATSAGTKAPALNITMLGGYVNNTELTALRDEATELFVTDPKKEIAFNFSYFNMEKPDQTTAVILQKIMAEVTVKELDILIVEEDLFKTYAEQGMFMRLDSIEGLSALTGEDVKLVNAKIEDEDTQEYPYGIDVEDNEMLKSVQYDTKGKVLGIVSNTERIELTLDFLKWMLKL